MSAASIDRYLAPAKAGDGNLGNSATKASPLLRSSIKVRIAGDEVEDEPGFFEGDMVAHRRRIGRSAAPQEVPVQGVHGSVVIEVPRLRRCHQGLRSNLAAMNRLAGVS